MPLASYLGAGREPAPGYKLIRVIGRGPTGSVWEATGPTGGKVALKFMGCGDGPSAAGEIRIIQAVRELRHPNLVRVHQVWCQRKDLVVSMELADSTLADVRQRNGLEAGQLLDPEVLCRYMAQAAGALDFLNARQHLVAGRKVGFQHGDVRPTNLLLFGEVVKLSDFSLAYQTGAPSPPQRRTAAPGYAAPELFQGRLGDSADQYSLAVSYCELRTGRHPFGLEAAQAQTLAATPPRSDADLSLLKPEEQPIVTRALAREPRDRWPTCREFIDRLSRAAW